MKIISSYFSQFEKSHANKNNLRFNSALATDIFEKRNISFTGENLFSKEEQAKLNALKLNHLRNRIIELKTQGLSFDEAIACLYLSNEQINQFKNINDKTLTIEDRIGLVAYEIGNIERFKEVRTQLPEQYEALLATKFGLSDEKIKKYLSKKGTFIEYFDGSGNLKKYTPSNDEWMICVKEGFTATQLQRFAQLRNRTKSFEDETVRKKEEQQAYPMGYIISCVKTGKSDDEIQQEEKILQYYQNGYDIDYIIYTEGLTEEEKWLYDMFFRYQVSNNMLASVFCKLSNNQQDLYWKQIQRGHSPFEAIHISSLNDEQLKQYCRHRKEKINRHNAIILTELNNEETKRYYEFIKQGLGKDDALRLAKLNNDGLKRYYELIELDFPSYQALKLAELDTEQFKRFYELMKRNFLDFQEIEFDKLDTELINKFFRCIKNNENNFDLIEYNKFDELEDEQISRFFKRIQEGFNDVESIFYAKLDDKQLKQYYDLIEQGIDRFNAIKLAQLNNEEIERYYNRIKSGMKQFEAIELAQLNDKELELYYELVQEFETAFLKKRDNYQTHREKRRFDDCVIPLIPELCFNVISKGNLDKYRKLYQITKDEIEATQLTNLTAVQIKKYFDFLNNGKAKFEAYGLAQLSPKQIEKYNKLLNSGIEPHKALRISRLTEEQYTIYKNSKGKITFEQALLLVKETSLRTLTPDLLEKLPDDFWYKINTGCEEETHGIIQKAIIELLLEQRGEYSSLNLTPLKTLGCQLEKPEQGNATVLYNKGTEYSLDKNSGDFELKTIKPFKVNFSQGLINQKPILIVKDKNSDNQYISYNGAISKVQSIQNHDSNQFKDWGNILPQKQSKILAQAADEFVFNLFDENGYCIIGQNAPSFDTKDKLDSEIEQYYSEKLLELKTNNKLNTQEILKLMPKNCMLTISPYIQDADFKYAIVCEWFSKDGHRWQMEIHSQDSKWNNDENWIFRLHKQTQSGRQYFQFTDNENGFNFNGATLDSNAHIKIPTPLEGNDLLNNVEFQTIIKQISMQQYKDFEIDKIASNLKIDGQNNEEKIQNIIDHCLKNPLDFARYKDVILKLRASLGMVELT